MRSASLLAHRDALDRIARALLEHESLEADDLDRVFRGEPLAAPADAGRAASPEPSAPERPRPETPLPRLRPKPEAST